MTNFTAGNISGSQVLVDATTSTSDSLYADYFNELRQSRACSAYVGRTEQSEYYCDGTADDVQIQAAIDAIATAGGGSVHLGPGTFTTTSRIVLKNQVNLIGSGWDTVLTIPDNLITIHSVVECDNSADGMTIAHLQINGNDQNNTSGATDDGHGIDATKSNSTPLSTNVKIFDCWIHNTRNSCVVLRDRTQVLLCRIGNAYSDHWAYYSNSNNSKIMGCDFYGYFNNEGIVFSTSDAVAKSLHDVFTNNTVNNLAHHPTAGGANEIDDMEYVLQLRDGAHHCIVANNSFTIGSDIIGYNIVRNVGTENMISGNTMEGDPIESSEFGAAISIPNDGAVKNSIIGNTIMDFGGRGIQVREGEVNIVGNTIIGTSTKRAITVWARERSIEKVNISNNYIDVDDDGIWLRTTDDYTFSTTKVTDNHITASGDAIINAENATILKNNLGFITENSGTGSITAAVTSDIITHGLDYTPAATDITITLTENPTNTPGAIWVDTIGATYFTVNCENVPGATNLDFSWAVRKV